MSRLCRLKTASRGDDGQWAYDEIVSLRKQRDELLAALERFMDSHEECTDFDGFTAQIVSMDDYHQAQDAIARAK